MQSPPRIVRQARTVLIGARFYHRRVSKFVRPLAFRRALDLRLAADLLDRRLRGDLGREHEAEPRASTLAVLHPDASMMRLDNAATDRETQAGAGDRLVARGPVELLEHLLF